LPPPTLSAKVQRLVDKAEDVKKEHVRFCKTAPHHALCPPALSPAEMLVKKYHDSRGTFSTRSSLNIIASLRVPLSPLFSVRHGKWSSGPEVREEKRKEEAKHRKFVERFTPREDLPWEPSCRRPSTVGVGTRDSFFLTGADLGHRNSSSRSPPRPSTEPDQPRLPSRSWGPRKIPAYPHRKRIPAWTPEAAMGNNASFHTPFVSSAFTHGMKFDMDSMRASLASRERASRGERPASSRHISSR